MIGILYESDEWSDHKLLAELVRQGVPARLVDMEGAGALDEALGCSFLVSRVFASAQFRNHGASLARMPRLAKEAARRGIPLVNPGRAHAFEVDKRLATETLAAAGLVVPAVLACARPPRLDPEEFAYPCIVKPNCGGRSTCTALLRDVGQAGAFLAQAPDIEFIVEEYVEPECGYLTRIELVDGACALVVKRSVAASGLSSYHEGSTYAPYDDCPAAVRAAAVRAGEVLGIVHGSFDVIECGRGPCIIDANSVSNVSEDCTELLSFDLMRAHAEAIARQYRAAAASRQGGPDGDAARTRRIPRP